VFSPLTDALFVLAVLFAAQGMELESAVAGIAACVNEALIYVAAVRSPSRAQPAPVVDDGIPRVPGDDD
jgi:hypothetical protein